MVIYIWNGYLRLFMKHVDEWTYLIDYFAIKTLAKAIFINHRTLSGSPWDWIGYGLWSI